MQLFDVHDLIIISFMSQGFSAFMSMWDSFKLCHSFSYFTASVWHQISAIHFAWIVVKNIIQKKALSNFLPIYSISVQLKYSVQHHK